MKPAKKERKYEEAYCSVTECLITIQTAVHLFQSLETKAKYKDHLLCPDCRKARLSYNGGRSPYYKAINQNEHDEDCSFLLDLVPKENIEHYVKSDSNHQQIERQMNGLITMLLTKKPTKSSSPKTVESPAYTSKTSSSHRKKAATPCLPRKRIDLRLEDDDFGVYKVFYGIVSVKLITAKTGRFGFELSDQQTKNKYCKIWMSPAVYSHVATTFEYSAGSQYAISFVAKLKKDGEERFTSLLRSQYIQLHKLY